MLQFSPTPLTLWIGIAALLAALVLAGVAWRRGQREKRSIALECLRLLCVLAAVLLLWQPEWRTLTQPNSKPEIVVLWDQSKSMETLDAPLKTDANGAPQIVSRAQWVQHTLESDWWQPLASNPAYQLTTMPFATPSADAKVLSATDLSAPLENVLEKSNNLRAVVMLSDGDYNIGEPPVAAAQKMRLRGVPLFAIPVGSKTRLPDLDILSVTAPTYGIIGENVQIPFTIRSSLDREVRTLVRIRDGKQQERSKSIVIPPQSELHDSILWRLDQAGDTLLDLAIPVADGERVTTNNERQFSIAGRQEKIRVLVVESVPRWEFRFLRNALSRDPGVELSCLLFHPELGMGRGRNYIDEFPNKIEDLATYDVIFLGDVGMQAGQLTKEQCALIRGLVEKQASGLVFLPGRQGNQFSLLDSDIGELMPVILDDSQRNGMSEMLASPLNLTTEGRGSLLTMLGNDEQENPEIWKRLPGFFWHAPVLQAKAGTEVLAVHGNRRGKFGPTPLIVTRAAGSGKILFMGIDSAWRWRRGVEDLYHYRFWGQVARWMSYQRNMAAGQRLRLFFNPERPEPGALVTLNVNAFDENGAPLENGSVLAEIIAPNQASNVLDLEKNEGSWGSFGGRFRLDQPGEWKIRASIAGSKESAVEAAIVSQGIEIEKTGQPARPEVLEEMAKISLGRMIQPDQVASLIREIHSLPEARAHESRVSLLGHWATMAAMIALLACFWIGRKIIGLF
ncbi:MAG: hypothetical protein EAZ42_10720 [Verrucomicrobia bacterium]|nr:MAG: hypothetical protein EAZ42_10720 [Verrucomicrobiota bacterium]